MIMPYRLTYTVKILLIANLAIFVFQQTVDRYMGGNLLGTFGLVPVDFILNFKFWQIFTYAFLHADVGHVFLNLLMLFFIGTELEATWGARRFIKYYLFCSIGAGMIYLVMLLFFWGNVGLRIPMVGASGAIYGLLIAYGILFGERVLLFMLLFPMKAKHFVWILAAVEFFTTLFSSHGAAFSSVAHLGGMGAGFIYLWLLARASAKRRSPVFSKNKKKKSRKNHLKLVIDNKEDDEKGSSSSGPKTWH